MYLIQLGGMLTFSMGHVALALWPSYLKGLLNFCAELEAGHKLSGLHF